MARVRVRLVTAILIGVMIGGVIAAAGGFGSKSSPSARPATQPASPPTQRQLAEQATAQQAARHDVAVQSEVNLMRRAAIRGDRGAVARAQATLERLAQTDPTPRRTSTEQDPFVRAVDDFAFKRAPLFVLQVRTTDASHRISAGVDRDAFCLMTPAARLAAVDGAYKPLEARLRRAGVRDLRFVVVALTQREPTAKQQLAIAERGIVRLTARGRAC